MNGQVEFELEEWQARVDELRVALDRVREERDNLKDAAASLAVELDKTKVALKAAATTVERLRLHIQQGIELYPGWRGKHGHGSWAHSAWSRYSASENTNGGVGGSHSSTNVSGSPMALLPGSGDLCSPLSAMGRSTSITEEGG